MTDTNPTIQQLRTQCHVDQLAKRPNSHSCQKLFFLALVKRDQQAWTAVCDEFRHMVIGWIYTHNKFRETGEDVSFFINEAFTRFWRYGTPLAQNGKFEKLGDYLQYLKRCVWTTIGDYLRRSKKDALWQAVGLAFVRESAQSTAKRSIERPLFVNEVVQVLWQITQENQRERLVAKATWIYGLPPRQIQAIYPNDFATISEISQIKRNILRRLQRHPQLKNQFGLIQGE